MHAASVLDLDSILLYPNIVVAVVNVNAAILGAEPDGRLQGILVEQIVDARQISAESSARISRGCCRRRLNTSHVLGVRIFRALGAEIVSINIS